MYGGPFSATIRETLFLEGQRGTSFLSSHASLDTVHLAELRDILNQLTSEDAKNAVIESVLVNFRQITSVFGVI